MLICFSDSSLAGRSGVGREGGKEERERKKKKERGTAVLFPAAEHLHYSEPAFIESVS